MPAPLPGTEELYKALLAGDTNEIKRLPLPEQTVGIVSFAVLYCPRASIIALDQKIGYEFERAIELEQIFGKAWKGCECSPACLAVFRHDPVVLTHLCSVCPPTCIHYGRKENFYVGAEALEFVLTRGKRKLTPEEARFIADTFVNLCQAQVPHIDEATEFVVPESSTQKWSPPACLSDPRVLALYPTLSSAINDCIEERINYTEETRVRRWLQAYARAYLQSKLGQKQRAAPR